MQRAASDATSPERQLRRSDTLRLLIRFDRLSKFRSRHDEKKHHAMTEQLGTAATRVVDRSESE